MLFRSKCYAYNIDNSGYDSYEEAVAELKHCLKQGVAEGSYKTYQPKHVAWVVTHGDGKVSEFKPHEDDAANAKYDQVKGNRGASIYAIDQHSQSIPMGSLRALRKKQGVAEAHSDISGLMAASNLNRSYIITAELAEGGTKKFRVKAQNERIALEKFQKHYKIGRAHV